MSTIVRVRALSKHWAGSSGLARTDLELRMHQLTVVRGRSGTGKSTLLALLAGWCEPDHGEIIRHGDWAAGDGWRRWSSTAVAPQVIALVGELTVAENLALPLRLAGEPIGECGPPVAAVLAALDLSELGDRLPGEVSMGQQQRVGVGRVAVLAPVLALVDEPTSHQDAAHAALVVALLRSLADGGAAVLVATHDPLVAAAADQLLDLDDPDTGAVPAGGQIDA